MQHAIPTASLSSQPAVVPRPLRDRVENFHGNQVLYVLWERHLIICAPLALAVPPSMSFAALVQQELPKTVFAQHPDWPRIDWRAVEWAISNVPFQPDPAKSLADNGLTHKTLLRLRTPGLNGVRGAGA